MSYALEFSQGYKEISGEKEMTNKKAISATMERFVEMIDKPKSIGNIIYFTDESWVVWTGIGWRVCELKEPSDESIHAKQEEHDEKIDRMSTRTYIRLEVLKPGKVKRTHYPNVVRNSKRLG